MLRWHNLLSEISN